MTTIPIFFLFSSAEVSNLVSSTDDGLVVRRTSTWWIDTCCNLPLLYPSATFETISTDCAMFVISILSDDLKLSNVLFRFVERRRREGPGGC